MRRQINPDVLLSKWEKKPPPVSRKTANGCRVFEQIERFWKHPLIVKKFKIIDLAIFCDVSRETARRWIKGARPREEYYSRLGMFFANPYISAGEIENQLRRLIDDLPRRIEK